MEPYRVGLIGCGAIFPMHAYPLVKSSRTALAAVCDVQPERAQQAAAQFGCAWYEDYQTMLRGERLDAVHILLPHHLHAPVAIDCLKKGLDVLCEKPMSIKLDQAQRMAQTAARAGARLGVVFQNRCNPGARFAKQALASGRLGRVIGGRCEVAWHRTGAYYAAGDWRGKWATEGGGVVINQAIHTLDLMRWLIDAPVASVNASLARHSDKPIEVEDTAEGLIRFSNGVQALFYLTNNNSWNAPVRIQLHCERGMLKLIGDECFAKYEDGTREASEPASRDDVYPAGKSYWGISHGDFIEAFYADADGAHTRAQLEEALKTQALIEAIYAAAGSLDIGR